MSTNLLQMLFFGEASGFATPADAIYVYEHWAPGIKPEKFNPFAFMQRGGFSFISNGDGDGDNALRAISMSSSWMWKCHAAGASPKNSIIALASHFDQEPGMVALALELAMVAAKPRTPPEIALDRETHSDIVDEVFVKNYAGIQSMADHWGIGLREGTRIERARTRSTWREELGHDVLIHPATLEPCKNADGIPLIYTKTDGTKEDGCFFYLVDPATGNAFTSKDYPSPH
jgi:hypothetical protein